MFTRHMSMPTGLTMLKVTADMTQEVDGSQDTLRSSPCKMQSQEHSVRVTKTRKQGLNIQACSMKNKC